MNSVTSYDSIITVIVSKFFFRKLSLSTNTIEKIANLNGLSKYVLPQALEVWPLNPLKCLKYEITVALRQLSSERAGVS